MHLTKAAGCIIIMPIGTPGVRGLTPRPNTGTGVKFPGEPVAVRAERSFRKAARLLSCHWPERVGKVKSRAGRLSRKTCPERPYKSHGFLAHCTGRAGRYSRPVFPAHFFRIPAPGFRENELPSLKSNILEMRLQK